MSQPNCPVCGRYCRDVVAHTKYDLLGPHVASIRAVCTVHGSQDVTKTCDWAYEDFFPEEDTNPGAG